MMTHVCLHLHVSYRSPLSAGSQTVLWTWSQARFLMAYLERCSIALHKSAVLTTPWLLLWDAIWWGYKGTRPPALRPLPLAGGGPAQVMAGLPPGPAPGHTAEAKLSQQTVLSPSPSNMTTQRHLPRRQTQLGQSRT